MTKHIALVVLSGGQDSTTCLALAMAEKKRGAFDEVHAVTFDYAQRHRRELDAAYQIGRLAGVDGHEFVEVGPILKGTSPLTDSTQPLEQYKDHDSMEAIIGARVEKTFVPMRNALFLTLAANRAVVLGATTIITGVCEADNANYPDCRADFIISQEQTINEALGFTRADDGFINIRTPLMNVSKPSSVAIMMGQGIDVFAWLAFSHTAYDGQYPPVGSDHATILRAHGFERAGLPDPLIVRAVSEDLMTYPATVNYLGMDTERTRELVEAIGRHKVALGWPDTADLNTAIDPTLQTR